MLGRKQEFESCASCTAAWRRWEDNMVVGGHCF